MCECSETPEQPADGQQCDRCRFLDGETRTAHRVIGAMREFGRAVTLAEVAQAAGYTERHTHRALRPLLISGRVSVLRAEVSARSPSIYSLRCS